MDSSSFCSLIDNLTINSPSDSKPWFWKLFGWQPLFPEYIAGAQHSNKIPAEIFDPNETDFDVLTCGGVYIIAQFPNDESRYTIPSEVDPLHNRVVYVGQTSRDVDAPLRARLTEYRKALLYQDANNSNPGAYHSGGNTRRWKETLGKQEKKDRFDASCEKHQNILASLHFAVYPIWFNDLLSQRGSYSELYKLRVNALARALEVILIGQLAEKRGIARDGLEDYSCYDFVHNLDNRH